MATDPRKLRPSECCRLLNSTPLGEVINERQLHRHRTRAGLRIGDARHVDLLRYTAWLVETRHAPKPEPDGDPYEKLKDRARARNVALAIAGRDIGVLPVVGNPDRKAQATFDFRLFCDSYFPLTFHLPWSPDHLKVIAKIEQAVLRGGLFAMAMPRGSGKTTICECACIWAVLYGHREFVCLIGSDEGHAMDMLDSIKTELDANDLLLEDFPEVVYPIQCLDGIANRCNGQLYQGERTHIGWTAREIVLPTMPESTASGAIIKVAGITGRIRGMKHKRADGHTVRPSLVVLDDPQTDESARSLSQCATRESILAGAVLGLAGPGQKISGIMPCTVIRPADMADNILSRDQHPEWNGERTKMVYSFPRDEKLWKQYAELRAESFRQGNAGEDATEFYREHQTAMDDGAVIAWAERYNHDELSAIQHAMNLKLQNEAAFFAEYQNDPIDLIAASDAPRFAGLETKLTKLSRGVVPVWASWLTCGIDVQKHLLYYVVTAWSDKFSGSVIDYGAWPGQSRPYFSLSEAHPTLQSASGSSQVEGAVYWGLQTLTDHLLHKKWQREGGGELTIGKAIIDANWSESTDTVYEFCRRSPFSGIVIPAHGKGLRAGDKPMIHYEKKTGEQLGFHWYLTFGSRQRAIRHCIHDVNFWKTFLAQRAAALAGEQGSLSMFGERSDQHRMFADHLAGESCERTFGRGREVWEWRARPNAENHWLDCLVMAGAAGSMLGATLENLSPAMKPPKPRRSLSAMQQARRRANWAMSGMR